LKNLTSLLSVLVVMLVTGCGAAQPTPSAVLTGSYTSVNSALMLNYPSGWTVEEQAGLVGVASSLSAMNATIEQRALNAGQAGGIITPLSAETLNLMAQQNGWEQVPTTAELIAFVASTITVGTLSEVIETTINGKSAAYVTLILDDGDSLAIVVDAGGGAYALLQAAAATGELAQFQNTFLAIAGTITFAPNASG
jgi:hypothetical protein